MPTALVLDPDMTASAIRAWHVIYTETIGRPGWDLSYVQIAKRIGGSRRTAVYAVGLLMKKGWIKQIPSNKGPGSPNLYVALQEPEVPVGGATDCTSEVPTGAVDCTGVVQLVALVGGATDCTTPGDSLTGRTDRTTKSIRAARGGQDGSVKIGNLSDDVEMPESGVAPAKKAPAKTGTHGWAKDEFVRLMRAARCGQTGTTQGVLNSAFKRLRDEGYSNEEIVALAQTFFTRHDQDIRAKRTEIDPSVMFVQRLPQLKAIKAEEIENKRAGIKTSVERSTEIQREAMKRLGITEESA